MIDLFPRATHHRLLDLKQGQNKQGQTILYLVFEYMDTDLKKYIRSFRQNRDMIPPKTIKVTSYATKRTVSLFYYMLQTIDSLLALDLKPHNLLMDRKTMMLKIADLGLSRAFTIPLKKYTHEILTLWYRAPEMLLGATHYSTPVDMWSIGCIFAELVTTHALFPGDSELQQLLYIFRLLGTPTEEVWPGVDRLSNWHEYPKWSPKSLSSAVPNLDADGLDLLSVQCATTTLHSAALDASYWPLTIGLIVRSLVAEITNRRVDLPNSAAPAALSKTLTTQTSETLLSDALFGDRPSALGSTPSLALEFGLMAEHLASIFGTEKDRVNCPFYFKIGACRHGDRCSRLHNRPTISPTLLLSNMYQRPDMVTPGVDAQGQPIDPQKIQEHFEDFYEDIFEELGKFGEIESLNVCDNLADHMIGNVYVQYREEEQAAAAMRALQGRFYSGRPIIVDFSPVTDFREATCRQFEENSCNRGGYCNFMHVKQIGRELRRKLFGRYRRSSIRRSRSRSPSPYYRRGSRDRDHGDYRDRGDYRDGGRRSGDRHGSYERDGGRRLHGNPRHTKSPIREGSEERRAKIEQWNRAREEKHG
ncbi:hypothetical protein MUK42_07525 [Musa troglodytarum]|uniref:Uncharacterized protein n=1 Tax=Musa troglodytarum TaxID=320322 RepID=A0A9E7L1D9_9LILI|nr:hypothetical protein MUK42_07525 [Musa troglodytarum]